jgi:hypothetical protein
VKAGKVVFVAYTDDTGVGPWMLGKAPDEMVDQGSAVVDVFSDEFAGADKVGVPDSSAKMLLRAELSWECSLAMTEESFWEGTEPSAEVGTITIDDWTEVGYSQLEMLCNHSGEPSDGLLVSVACGTVALEVFRVGRSYV